MPTWLLVLIISVLFVAFFVLAMSITLIVKGRNIDSEISTNKHMRERGITCAVEDTRRMDGDECSDNAVGCSSDGNCAACDIVHGKRQATKNPRL